MCGNRLYNPFTRPRFGKLLRPVGNRWVVLLVERFGNGPTIAIVQTSDSFAYRDRLSFDRFHPNDEGYSLIGRRIADAI